MNRSIQRTWKRVLSIVLVFALLLPMIPAPVFAAGANETKYQALEKRMNDAKTTIEAISVTYGEVDLGGGYKVNLKTALNEAASNITHDLDVAKAIIGGNPNDPRFAGVNNSQKGGIYTYNQDAFNAAFGTTAENRYAAAVSYLENGGIAKQGTYWKPLLKTYFISYKSKLNPDYTASVGILGPDEGGKADIVKRAEEYSETVGTAVSTLSGMIALLNTYRQEADQLESYFLSAVCTEPSCEHFGTAFDDVEKTGCDDWTHRLLVPEGGSRAAEVTVFTKAWNEFKDALDRDIKIAGILATGSIDSELLWFANENNNGHNYYNNTVAVTTLDKINAAISFLENGGYHCGKTKFDWGWKWENQLAYRSNLNPDYNVGISTLGEIEISNTNAVLPLAEATLSILRAGTTSDNLGVVYQARVDEINKYIERARKLDPTKLPDGATYSQEEFAQAIQAFLDNTARDLKIAEFLRNGQLDSGMAKTWAEDLGIILPSLKDKYKDMSDAVRYANAIRFFNEGGYAYGYSISFFGKEYGYKLEYVSAFYPDYSSGLFGIGANKTNAVTIMRDTINALEKGHKHMSAAQLAKLRYDQALKSLEDLKKSPSAIVNALLENDPELKQFIADLDTVVDSLDNILQALDTLERMGIGADILNPVLEPLGLSYEKLIQIRDLKGLLDGLPVDILGEGSIEDSMGPIVAGLIGVAIDGYIVAANLAAIPKTEAAYNAAADILEDAQNGLLTNASEIIRTTLKPIMEIVEPIRPYVDMLNAGIRLMNRVITLADQINGLTKDFTVGGLSQATYTMSYSLDDMADLLEALNKTGMGKGLAELLANSDLGGPIANQTAGMLNKLIEQMIQQQVEISGDDLSFLSDTVNSLNQFFAEQLKNPGTLVSMLRTSADILARIAELEGGMQNIIDGEYEQAWAALSNNWGSMFRDTVTLWNELVALFETPKAAQAATFAMGMDSEEMNLSTLNGDVFLEALVQGVGDEAEATLAVLKDESASPSAKLAKITEFKEFLKDLGKFVEALRDMSKNVKSACDWANSNLSKEQAKAFAAQLASHYVGEMRDCVKSGVYHNNLKSIISEMKSAAQEVKDILCFIKTTGDLEIIATPGGEDVLYTFTTNYDELQAKLAPVLEALGISTRYTVISPSDQFQIANGNALVATSDDLEEKIYQVKVAYQLFLSVCGHEAFSTLARTTVSVQIGEGPVEPGDEFIVTFDANGGTLAAGAPSSITEESGTVIQLPGATREDYDFDGWFDGEDLVGGAGDEYTVNKTVTLTAHWTENTPVIPGEDEFTVTFDANGGILAAGAAGSVTVASGTAITLPGATRANYTFNGWYEGATKVGDANSSYTVNGTVTLVASWTAITPGPSGPSGGGGGGGGTTTIQDEEIPLGGIFSLMSLPAEPRDGIVYYIDDSGKTVFVPFCFVIGDKIYFFGQVGIDYKVKANHKEFGDIGGHWAYDNILAIAEREAFQGYPDNSFQPNRSMTRSMLAVALARMATADTGAYNTRIFDDVAPDAWYGPSVAWAFEKGIVTGMGNNKFNPDANVTRQEIAVMLARFINYMQIEMKATTAVPFADQDQASAWAKAAATDMQKYEIIGGKANNLFDPYADSTRAEIATMLHRLIQNSITHAQATDAEAVKKTN